MTEPTFVWIINGLLVLVSAVGGWFMRQLWDAVNDLKADLSELRLHISENYVSYPRLRDLINPIMQALDEIKHTLKEKVDK